MGGVKFSSERIESFHTGNAGFCCTTRSEPESLTAELDSSKELLLGYGQKRHTDVNVSYNSD